MYYKYTKHLLNQKNMNIKKLIDNIYHFLLVNLPRKWMYKSVYIDPHHKMYVPKFGWSAKQKKEAESQTKDWLEKIIFEPTPEEW